MANNPQTQACIDSVTKSLGEQVEPWARLLAAEWCSAGFPDARIVTAIEFLRRWFALMSGIREIEEIRSLPSAEVDRAKACVLAGEAPFDVLQRLRSGKPILPATAKPPTSPSFAIDDLRESERAYREEASEGRLDCEDCDVAILIVRRVNALLLALRALSDAGQLASEEEAAIREVYAGALVETVLARISLGAIKPTALATAAPIN